MTLVDVHAAALLALPAVTCIVCILVPHQRPNSRQVTIAAGVAGGSIIVVLGLNSHLCNAGNPAMQCVVAGVCTWFIVAFVKSKWFRAIASVVMAGVMFVLSSHYDSLVHGRAWVGNVRHLAAVEKLMDGQLDSLRNEVQGVGMTDDIEYPAGWLRELAFRSQLEDAIGEKLPSRVESKRVWHSSFTGLKKVNRVRQDFWYPGGRLADAAEGIELRDVP